MRRFYLERPPEDATVTVAGLEARHILKVLRLKRGDEILLFDRLGTAYQGSITDIRAGAAVITIAETFAPQKGEGVVLLQAVLKSHKMDYIIQKATELGCSRIVPFFSSRCIPRWDDDKCAQKQHHWQQIAIAAVKQSGVRQVPVIEQPCGLESAVQSCAPDALKTLLWENEQAVSFKALLKTKRSGQPIACAVGPEGGFSHAEVELARACGFVTAGLGATILRAETVPLVLLSIIGYETGSIG